MKDLLKLNKMDSKQTGSLVDESFKRRICEQLKQANLLKFGEFTLRSGLKSNFYLDLRLATMEPVYEALVEAIGKIVEHCIELEPGNSAPVAIIGMPYGAVPIAASVAHSLRLRYYPLRKETKAYGVQTDADLYKNYRFILIEDTMTTGGSVLEMLEKLAGKNVTDLVVIADRREVSEQNSIEAKHPRLRVHSLLKKSDLLSDE